MPTLPTITETIDDKFVTTWYEIRKKAIDNILDSNIVTAFLRQEGAFTPQVGGKFITRTLKYGKKTKTNTSRGSTLSSGIDDIETMAMWTWRYSHAHVQRSLIDDQQNSGPNAIKSLVAMKLQAARDALDTGIEQDLLADYTSPSSAADERAETGPQSLFSFIKRDADWDGAYYYGGILHDSENPWFQRQGNKDTAGTGDAWDKPREIYLLSNMRSTFNYCGRGSDFPTGMLTDQATFELYDDFAEYKTQSVKQV